MPRAATSRNEPNPSAPLREACAPRRPERQTLEPAGLPFTASPVLAYAPPVAFALSWLFAVLGWNAPGTDAATPFAEQALRWILYLALGWTAAVGSLVHTVFARSTASSIGWETNGFQYEVGFANLAIGLAGIYAGSSARPEAWIAASIAGGIFLLLAGLNHIVEIVRHKNYAPGNTVILLSDLGVPISLFSLLISTRAVL